MKGLFTQTAVLLTGGRIDIDEIARHLSSCGEIRKSEAGTDWPFGTATLRVPFRPEVNGYVSVDYVPRTWPDSMGDPKTDTVVFGAWSMGFFGPFAYPGGLERAQAQCWVWDEGAKVSASHDGFIRFRCSYSMGADPNAPVAPKDYNAVAELTALMKMVEMCAAMPNILCYFNPNGETLYSPGEFSDTLQFNERSGLPSLDLWTNIRLYNLDDQARGWFVQDTVGLEQLDVPDQEAVFVRNRYDPQEIAQFLRNVSMYLVSNNVTINNGDTIDGPGGISWQGYHHDQALASPPRPVIRWFPVDRTPRPSILTERKSQ